jgi:O-antigen/teichoic acid export membrane protein
MLTTLALGSSAAFLIQSSSAGIVYGSQILLARWMGSIEYGAYVYALSWAQLIASVCSLGFTTAVLRFIPSYIAQEDWCRLRGVIAYARWLTLGAAVALACLGTLILFWGQPQNVHMGTLLLGVWLVPLLALMNLHTEMIRGTQHIPRAYAPSFLLQPILTIGIAFCLLQAAGALISIDAIIAFALATLAAFVVQVRGLQRSLPTESCDVCPVYEPAGWLSVSLPLMLVAGFFILLKRTDVLMIGMLIGPSDAGIYEAATRTATLVSFVLLAVNSIAAPMIASHHAKADYASMQRMVSTAISWMFWPSLMIAVGLILLGGPILGLFGPDFREGQWALRIIVMGQLLNVVAGPVGYLMGLTGHQNLTALVFGLTALLNIALNAIFISLWGIVGAAAATTTAMVVWNVWLVILVKKHLGIRSLLFARGY